jgi:AraC-like DNA-binding protein
MSNFHEIIQVPDNALAWVYLFSENNITEVSQHWHDSFELTLIVRGTAPYWINGRRIRAAAGDLLFINAGDMHSCSIDSDECEAVTIMFPRRFLAQFSNSDDMILFQLDAKSAAYPELVCKCENLYHVFAMRKEDPYAQLHINSIVYDIAYLLFSQFRWKEFSPQSVDSIKYRRRCREIIEYLDDHYQDDISMKDLVGALGISREHLTRIFREHMGTSYKRYITRLRMYHAYTLLTGSDLSIIEIAMRCGFSDCRAFITSFRGIYGTTPGKYRRTFQNVQSDFKDAVRNDAFYRLKETARRNEDHPARGILRAPDNAIEPANIEPLPVK